MSDNDQTQDQDQQDIGQSQEDELTILKQRARMMGVEFSNNIGLETLKQRIQDKMDGNAGVPETVEAQPSAPPLVDPSLASASKPVKVRTLRQMLIEEQMKLVRIRIQNLDPKKKDLPGEIITVANEYLGTVRKYVPYGEVTDGGWHVPYCIYELLRARKFLNLRTYTDRRNGGNIKVEQGWAQEFSIEVLPPLTGEELKKLAATQAAAGAVN